MSAGDGLKPSRTPVDVLHPRRNTNPSDGESDTPGERPPCTTASPGVAPCLVPSIFWFCSSRLSAQRSSISAGDIGVTHGVCCARSALSAATGCPTSDGLGRPRPVALRLAMTGECQCQPSARALSRQRPH